MAEVSTAERVFKLGQMMLADPDPDAAPEDALALYRGTYPALAHCTLAEPRLEGGRLVYEVQRPAATTKGAKDAPQDALMAEIDSWERDFLTRQRGAADPDIVAEAERMATRCLRRERSVGAFDPKSIPMC